MEHLRLPEKWNDWNILEKVGEGSYGTVYKAERKIGRESLFSAIKIIQIPKEDAEIQEVMRILGKESIQTYYLDLVDDYIREIQTMTRLQGITNIVSIQDYVVDELKDKVGWIIYIRMEFLTSFTEYLLTHQMKETDVVKLGIDLCTALEFCEKTKIVHRDIKPENIFYSELGYFKLGDFGIARKMDRSLSVYSSKGTFSYMAPEVFHGEQYDHRADIYSLGLVMYRLINGNREPFLPKDRQMVYYRDREEALQRRMSGETPDPPANSSARLSEVILKAMAADPKDRYHSANEMKRDLEQYLHEEKTRTADQLVLGKDAVIPKTKVGRKGAFIIVGIAGLFLIGCLIFFLNKGKSRSTKTDQELITESMEKDMTHLVPMEETQKEEVSAEPSQTALVQTEKPLIEKETIQTEKVQTEVLQTEKDEVQKSPIEINLTESMKTGILQEETVQARINDSDEESILIDITDCAGFVIRPSGEVVKYYNKQKLIQLLVEATGLQDTDQAVSTLSEQLKKQFILDPSGNYSKGDVITMRYQPDDEYQIMLEEIGCVFKYRGQSKAYQGEQEE